MINRNSSTFGKVAAFSALLLLIASPAFGQTNKGQNGTTLAGYKTLDICSVNETTWRYSGEIAVWNEGVIDTAGLNIIDYIEHKTGTKWVKPFPDMVVTPYPYGEIPAGSTKETATTFKYTYDGKPLAGTIRNNVDITISNHSGSLGKPKGPSPNATWYGEVKACPVDLGCTYSQGYWKTHPDLWPAGYSPKATFFLGQSWEYYLANPGGSGYNILAVQYIGAVLNAANGAYVPSGVQTTLNLATEWLNTNAPSACDAKGSCGLQKDWGAVLDDYNEGKYEGGPPHCQ